MRPFPKDEVVNALKNAKAVAVLEKDISFGSEGTVYTNVNSALLAGGVQIPTQNYVGGLGGKNISEEEINSIFEDLKSPDRKVHFLGIEEEA